MAENQRRTPPDEGRIRLGSVALGAALVMPTQYWISTTWAGFSIMSLFVHVVFITFALAGLNFALRRLSRRLALRPGELLIVYTMLAVAQTAGGHDTIEMLTQVIGYPAKFSTAENDWRALFHHMLPRWLFVWDRSAVDGLYTQGMDLYEEGGWRHFLRPALYWSAFLVTMMFLVMCLNIILRRQWVERERLAFPVAQIPLGIMDPRPGVLSSRLFWGAFVGTAALSLMNGLHSLFPVVPGPTYGRFALGGLFTESPWNVIGDVYIEFLPFVTGLSFFIPGALSFSIWFFYWFWKMEHVMGAAVGLHFIPSFPGYWMQGMGAVMLMACLSLYAARRHLGDVLRVVGRARSGGDGDDSPYRFAVWGAAAGASALLVFMCVAGMAPWFAVLFLGGYCAMSMVTARLRAQVGPPTHEIPFTTSSMLTALIGVKRIDKMSLAQVPVFKFVDFGQRGSPMPTMLESMYIRDRLRLRQPGVLLVAMMVAAVLGTLFGFAGNLQRGHVRAAQTWVGDGSFPRLAEQVRTHAAGVDLVYLVYFVVGAGVVVGLNAMSRAYVWWPFHPLGYIMGGEWMLRHLWFPIFLAWLIRTTGLKFGGMSAHRKAVHFFLGVTVADATMLGLWRLVGSILNRWTLSFVY